MSKPTKFSDYILEKHLGSGATADVYLAYKALKTESAEKPEPKHFVALKIFKPSALLDAHAAERIYREWQAAQRLDHPGLLKVFDLVNDENGQSALSMEYIDGRSLTEWQPLLPFIAPEVALVIIRLVLAALHSAHNSGVLHRDLKPSNILMDKQGRVVISDFGLARLNEQSSQTMTGTILGSPDFMSPEQVLGESASEGSDVFSVAAILYFLVTGTKPFSRPSTVATLHAIAQLQYDPVQNRNPKISARLAALIHKGLSAQVGTGPKDRYPNAMAFLLAIESYLNEFAGPFDLSAWARSPHEQTYLYLQQMAERLEKKASTLLNQNNLPEAFESISHLSLVAPDSTALAQLLSQYSEMSATSPTSSADTSAAFTDSSSSESSSSNTQKIMDTANSSDDHHATMARMNSSSSAKNRKAGLYLAMILFLGMGLFFVFFNNRSSQTVPIVTPVSVAPDTKPTMGTDSKPAPSPNVIGANDTNVSTAHTAGTSHTITEETHFVPSKPAAQSYGIIQFFVPKGVHIYLDGEPVQNGKAIKTFIGDHKIRLEREGYDDITQVVQVSHKEPTIIRVK